MKTKKLLKSNSQNDTLCAPGVGVFSATVDSGLLVEPGQAVGVLKCLSQNIQILMPEGDAGRIQWVNAQARQSSVGYGEVLASFTPWVGSDGDPSQSDEKTSAAETFPSPMEGLFYTRPDPESPPFVTQGQSIKSGDQVGLIEVMKTFYPIFYEGSVSKKVTAIQVENAQPVEIGTVLFNLA